MTAAPRPRVLFVSTSSTVGGAEKTLYTLATLLDPSRFDVAGVVSLKPKGRYAERLEAAGHRVFSLGVAKSPGLRQLITLAGIVAETRPDVVHAVMYQAMQACRAVKRLGWGDYALLCSPRVHYRTRSRSSLWVDRRLKSADDLVVTESEASRAYLEKARGYDPAKLQTVYNGVDITSWPVSRTDRERLRAEMGMEPKEVLLGAVGRLDEQKGYAYLLEAVAKLRALHPVRCVILGEGPQRPELELLVKDLKLEGVALLPGERPDVPAWLSAMDVFVLPSLWEGLPNALLEAMAMGRPVVASRVDGVPEVVLHDETGLLCEPADSQSLFVAIQDILTAPEIGRRLGEAARRSIQERFKLSDMLSAYETAYARLARLPA